MLCPALMFMYLTCFWLETLVSLNRNPLFLRLSKKFESSARDRQRLTSLWCSVQSIEPVRVTSTVISRLTSYVHKIMYKGKQRNQDNSVRIATTLLAVLSIFRIPISERNFFLLQKRLYWLWGPPCFPMSR